MLVTQCYLGTRTGIAGIHDAQMQPPRDDPATWGALAAFAVSLVKVGAPEELASYCLHALTAARALPSDAAVKRLVAITLDGLRPPR
jgi:hypothetical protein